MNKRRILLVSAIILVLLATYLISKVSRSTKPIEIPDEATSSSQTTGKTNEEMTQVTYVFDGDTIEVERGRRVRYIGVNAPEIAHQGAKEECYGIIAKDENISLVSGKTVRLVGDVADKDKYGRLLRYVYVGNEFINDVLVRQGFAVAEPIKPDTEYAKEFLAAQNEAKQLGRGLWSHCPR